MAGSCHPLEYSLALRLWFGLWNFKQSTTKLQEKPQGLGRKRCQIAQAAINFKPQAFKKKSYKQLKTWTVHLPRNKLKTLFLIASSVDVLRGVRKKCTNASVIVTYKSALLTDPQTCTVHWPLVICCSIAYVLQKACLVTACFLQPMLS